MAFFSKSLRNWTKKHDFIEGLTEWSPTKYAELTEFTAEFFPTEYAELTEFITEYSPTDFTEIHRIYCWVFAHRIRRTHRIYYWVFSHRFHRNTQNLLQSILPQISDAILGGALVSARLCRLPEQEVHQPSKQWSSHRFHRSTQMVRVRIIKTTKYAHVKDGEVADSIAVEHNVLATFFPTLFHRRRTESNRTANGNRSDGERNLIGRRTETDRTADANGGTLRGCTCLKCTNRARVAPTEQELHQPSKKCTNRARMHQPSKSCTLCKPHQ